MIRSTAIFGKGGTGKTFVTAHVAASLEYSGVRTLVVGCDPKQDTRRALTADWAPSLSEAAQDTHGGAGAVQAKAVITPVSEYVDVMEMGGPPLLLGLQGAHFEEAWAFFEAQELWERYQHILFDVNEERFDRACLPLLRQVEAVIGVANDGPESLFVVNRMARAVLLGNYEGETKARLLGMVLNRSTDPSVFDAYMQQTKFLPLGTTPEDPELGRLRDFHRTLFSLQPEPPQYKTVVEDYLRIGDYLQGAPFLLLPVCPLPDEDLWKLAPAAGLKVS